jgi:hypothetical protein
LKNIITAGDPRMGITIRNDPTKSDTQEANGDFFENFGINQYSLNWRNDVLNLIEKVYPSLEPERLIFTHTAKPAYFKFQILMKKGLVDYDMICKCSR